MRSKIAPALTKEAEKTKGKTMANPFLTNNALSEFISGLKISQERKEFLLSAIPELDEEERTSLFDVLKEIYLLDLEEEKAIQRVKKFWQK